MRALTTEITILLCVAVALGRAQSSNEEVGALTVQMKTLLGGKLPPSHVRIRSKSGELISSVEATNEIKIVLPYGAYVVTVEGTFLETASREVVVNRPNCFLVLATDMARFVLDTEMKPVAVSVQAIPHESCDAHERLWAKLVGVYGDYSAEEPIGLHGFALFEPLQVGIYVLMIAEGGRVRAVMPVTTKGPVTTVKAQLSPCE